MHPLKHYMCCVPSALTRTYQLKHCVLCTICFNTNVPIKTLCLLCTICFNTNTVHYGVLCLSLKKVYALSTKCMKWIPYDYYNSGYLLICYTVVWCRLKVLEIICISSSNQLIVVTVCRCVCFQEGIYFILIAFLTKDKATWARYETSNRLDHRFSGLTVILFLSLWACNKMPC